MSSTYEELISTKEGMKLFQRERTILEVTELICGILSGQKLKRSELAARLGTTKSNVTQLLDGEANMTLATVSDVFTALGQELHVSATPIGVEIIPASVQYDFQPWNFVTSPALRIAPTFTIEQTAPACGPLAA